MKTELLALIDELVKFKLHAAEGKISAEKDARQIRSNIEFLLGQPQSPEFDFAAKLKLEDLLARGYTVSGLALEKPAADGRSERGFITAGGFVGWWRDRSPAVVEPVGFKPLEWTEPLPPVEGCAYDHVKAKTSLGEASIEWKDWKICKSYVAYLRDEYIGVGTTLNETKELVATHLYSMVAGLLAAPVTKPKGFALVPLRLTGAMNQVLETEGWQWQDLLAEAESITEEEYAWIAAGHPAAPADALTDQQIRAWWMADNALEDADMCKLDDFTKVVRAVEAKFAGRNQDAVAQPTRQALRDLVDATWSKCTASSEVPGTPLADLLIDGVFSGAATPAAVDPVAHLEVNRVLSIADVHARESREDGIRLIDMGGLVAFAGDVLRAATSAAPADALDAEIALRKVLSAVQLYLPPDGISIDDAMNEVIAAVDPWPIGRAKDES